MQTAEIILRYLEVILTWPVAGVVLGLVAMKWFRGPVSDFLRRVVRGEAYGVRLEAANPTDQRKEAQDVPKPQSGDAIEQYIRDNPKEVIREYLRAVNGYRFERAYNLIYGTQLDLLEHLSRIGEPGEPYINLVPFYNEFVKRSNLAATQMADYLGFLRDMLFIEYIGTGTDLRARITPLGVDFLSYIKGQYPTVYKYKAY